MVEQNLPYDGLVISKGLGYKMDYMFGEKIYYIVNNTPVMLTDVIDLDNRLKKDISSLYLVSDRVAEFPSHIYKTDIEIYHTPVDYNTFVLDNLFSNKRYFELEYKDIFRDGNYVRISHDQAYPILDYMNKFEKKNLNRANFSNNMDSVNFKYVLGDYHIASDLRTKEWHNQSSKVKQPRAFEGETTMLHTSV